MDDGRRVREVLSYSRRGSRFTTRQAAAWEAHHERWVIPDEAVDEPDFTWARWFGRDAPLAVEIGCGIGEATAALAASRPDVNVLALEVWLPGAAETMDRVAAAGLTNVRLCGVDAVWLLEHLVEPDSLEELWTFFPDPWHKAKHHKRRLVTAGFAASAARRLRPGAWWRLATDWTAYAVQSVARATGHQVRAQGTGGRPDDHRPRLPARGGRSGRGSPSGVPQDRRRRTPQLLG
jgi:tRNA (guanine-N7-)-methyltransferase